MVTSPIFDIPGGGGDAVRAIFDRLCSARMLAVHEENFSPRRVSLIAKTRRRLSTPPYLVSPYPYRYPHYLCHVLSAFSGLTASFSFWGRAGVK